MPLCVPVVFNQQLVMEKHHVLPQRSTPQLTVSWFLLGPRLLLTTFTFCLPLFALVTILDTHGEDAATVLRIFICVIQASSVSFDALLIVPFINDNVERMNELSAFNREYRNLLGAKAAWFLWIVAASIVILPTLISSSYSAAIIGCFSIDLVIWRKHQRYYSTMMVKAAKMLIEDIQAKVGLDNSVSKAIVADFETCNISNEMLWDDVPVASRDTTIQPYCGRIKIVGNGESWLYFVAWSSYVDIGKRIRSDTATGNELITRNSVLRRELNEQNERILQLRTRIYGPNYNCTDVNQVPNCPAVVENWIPEAVNGLFVSTKGNITCYIEPRDFQKLALRAAFVRKSIPLLENEKRLLKEGLQSRKKTIDELVVKILNEKNTSGESIQIQMDH